MIETLLYNLLSAIYSGATYIIQFNQRRFEMVSVKTGLGCSSNV